MSDVLPAITDHDGDQDSLFGSPPPSPSAGRSPSPLAFPSGTAQNVGTLALPGSHLVAELPVPPPASLPLSARASTHSQPSASRVQRTPSGLQPGVSLQRALCSHRKPDGSCSARAGSVPRRPRKGKERAQSTPRPTPPPIHLPSPDEPPPPNFLRNQQALLGLAGMVGGVNPANLSKARPTRGATAENPIVVEDEPTFSHQPFIGKWPSRSGPSDASQLLQPTSEQILGSLLQQKNVFPVVVSLLRLLVSGAPSLTSMPFNYSHPPDFSSSSSAWSQTRSQSPEQSSRLSAPPLKRRKLNSVPAGATDWDVPYPFREGQGPENYRDVWERDRGKQLLVDLAQLVRGAAEKAATKAWYQQQQQLRRRLAQGAPTMKYYRPATLFYGLERGTAAQLGHSGTPCVAMQTRSGTPTSMSVGEDQVFPLTPSVQTPISQSSSQIPNLSREVFEQIVDSLLGASGGPSDGFNAAMPAGATGISPSATSEENNQPFFNSWLEMLNTFPPGDPNDGVADAPACGTFMSSTRIRLFETNSATTSANVPSSHSIPDHLIDPQLMEIDQTSTVASSSAASIDESHKVMTFSDVSPVVTGISDVAMNKPHPSTPTSPSMTMSSLTESADAWPRTPSLDWTSPDNLDDGLSEEMKLLGALAGMDVDVDIDAVIREWEASAPMAAAHMEASLAAITGGRAAPSNHHAQPDPSDTTLQSSAEPPLNHGSERSSYEPENRDTEAQPPFPQPSEAGEGPPSAGPYSQVASLGRHSSPSSAVMLPQFASLQPPTVPQVSRPAQLDGVSTVALTPGTVASPVPVSARAKGKAKAIPGTGNGVGGASSSAGKLDRKAVLEKARAMRAALAAEVERAKIALWETTLEQGVLVGLGRELEKGTEGC